MAHVFPRAHQRYPLGAPSEPDPPDPVRRYLQDAFWFEGGQLTLDQLRPRQRHGGEKPQRRCGEDGLHERLGDERLGAFIVGATTRRSRPPSRRTATTPRPTKNQACLRGRKEDRELEPRVATPPWSHDLLAPARIAHCSAARRISSRNSMIWRGSSPFVGFVQNQEVGLVEHSLGKRHPLAVPAGEAADDSVAHVLQGEALAGDGKSFPQLFSFKTAQTSHEREELVDTKSVKRVVKPMGSTEG